MFTDPNLWDQPVSLAREHGRATPDTPSSGNRVPGGGPSGSGAPHSPGSPTGGTGARSGQTNTLMPFEIKLCVLAVEPAASHHYIISYCFQRTL